MMDMPNELEPVLKFLGQYEPYRSMLPTHQEYLAMHLEQLFFAESEIITGPEDDELNGLYIIKSGRVSDNSGPGRTPLAAGDCFPVNALVEHRAVAIQLKAINSTICYQLKQPHFDYLMQQSSVFREYCLNKKASF